MRTLGSILSCRGAELAEIPLEGIVPGDIVGMKGEDIIPGDGRILSSRDLFINGSTLTGKRPRREGHRPAARRH